MRCNGSQRKMKFQRQNFQVLYTNKYQVKPLNNICWIQKIKGIKRCFSEEEVGGAECIELRNMEGEVMKVAEVNSTNNYFKELHGK